MIHDEIRDAMYAFSPAEAEIFRKEVYDATRRISDDDNRIISGYDTRKKVCVTNFTHFRAACLD